MQGLIDLANLELSVGRVGPGDIKAVDALLKDIVYRTMCFREASVLSVPSDRG